MAYFPNGTTFAGWQDENCTDCVNYRDNGSGSYGCPITDAHWLHDYHKGTNAKVLNELIPDDVEHQCRMRLTREQMEAEEFQQNHQLDLARYEAAMTEMRSA